MWWIGAAITLSLTVLCGVYTGVSVARGQTSLGNPATLAWLVGFHGGGGVLGLWLVMQAVAASH